MKIPLFIFVLSSEILCTPITWRKSTLLFNNIIGNPIESFSVGILWSNSLLLIFNIIPKKHDGSSLKGFFMVNTSLYLYNKFPFL